MSISEKEVRLNQRFTNEFGAKNIIDYFSKTSNIKIESVYIEIYDSDVRKITNLVTNESKIEAKNVVNEYKRSLYKYVESTETRVKEISGKKVMDVYRLRYIIPYNKHEIHVTFRTEITEVIKPIISIEIELNKELGESKIEDIVRNVFDIHNKYNVPNFDSNIIAAQNIVKNIIGSTKTLQKPYDITWRDLTFDSLIKNQHSISFKADGIRMLLMLTNFGSFLITSSLNIISVNNTTYNSTTIIDGELIDDDYWSFDLIYNGESYTNFNYIERHKKLLEIVNDIRKRNIVKELDVNIKPIELPKTATEFFNIIEGIFTKVKIPIDGIILTKINQSYSEPVFKYKQPERLTIDMFIGKDNTAVLFKDKKFIEYPEIELTNLPENSIGKVAEFKYISENKWEYVRQRWDKAIPNSDKVYQNIINIHKDPITLDVITGKSFKLMRKYHNRMKSLTYSCLSQNGVRTILDIGSGKGGDLSKWIDNSLDVYAIEPNIEFISELKERAKNLGGIIKDDDIYFDMNQITIFNKSAEDIVKDYLYDLEKIDAITMFNSATFLSISTISDLLFMYGQPPSYLVIMVMDGKCIISTFLKNDKYESKLLKINKLTENKLSIQIKDSSTVEKEQEENIVDINTLVNAIQKIGYIIDTNISLDQEKLLGEEEAKYSKCQKLLVFKLEASSAQYIRYNYLPANIGEELLIKDTPYGELVRVGVPNKGLKMSDNYSIYHSVLYVSDPNYRKLSDIEKVLYTINKVGKIKIPYKIYFIGQDNWNIYSQEFIYPYNTIDEREPGIVLMCNNGYFEPVAKRSIEGILNFIW